MNMHEFKYLLHFMVFCLGSAAVIASCCCLATGCCFSVPAAVIGAAHPVSIPAAAIGSTAPCCFPSLQDFHHYCPDCNKPFETDKEALIAKAASWLDGWIHLQHFLAKMCRPTMKKLILEMLLRK